MHYQKTDAIIVGQGVAGSWLSYYLLEAGLSVLVVDDFRPGGSSRIASGIINPITGHKHVKTWLADTVLPFATSAYTNLGNRLGVSLCRPCELVWLLEDTKSVNDFSVLSDRSGYGSFIGDVNIGSYCSGLQPYAGYGTVHITYIDMGVFLSAYRRHLNARGILQAETLDYGDIEITEYGVRWKNWEARRLFFCEGYDTALCNPYWAGLPFVPAKGEVLLVEIAGLELNNAILKAGIFVVPTAQAGVYWVGSNYEHQFENSLPSEATRHYLSAELEKVIQVPYKILDHWASVRPASRDRRPFVGMHPRYKGIGIFNGMGTKGVSLSPYFAQQFVSHLTNGTALHSEVLLSRIAHL